MSVVGFDFGSASCKVAVARRRGIDVLQNEVGHRLTPSMVAFAGKQRLIGNEASAQLMSNPSNTVTQIKRFLGRPFNDPELKLEQNFINYKLVNSRNGYTGIEVRYDDNIQQFAPEQITGALFGKLKQIAESGLEGVKVTDCVIGVPSWWNDQQRRALLDAANVSGLNVLRLMNETTAVGLNYGILRPLPKDREQKVLFLDLGYSQCNVMLGSFTEGKLTVLGTASDHNLGGRSFDDLLVQHFSKYIKEKYKMDVTTDIKAMMKLRKECERVKLNLSANVKVPFSVEYIMNDRDVSGMIERQEFEALAAQSLLPRLIKPISDLLAKTGVKKEELHSIEIVGGATRIPMVQRGLSEFLGRDISKTCDGDESVARGCALQCAMISPSFKVREFEVVDASPYPISLEWGKVTKNWQSNDLSDWQPEDHCALFTPNNPIPSVKLISFNDRTEPFQIVAKYSDPANLPSGTNPLIGRFIISGMPQRQGDKKIPKIKVRVKLNLHGLLQVTSAQLVEEIIDTTANNTNTKVEDTPMPDQNATSQPSNNTETNTQQQQGDAKMDTGETKPASTAAAEPPKTKVKREDLKVESYFTGGVDSATLSAWFEREVQMANQDRVIFETNEARNSLESYILEMRNQLSDQLSSYVGEDDKNKLLSLLDEAESWLYGEGSEAVKSAYIKKLQDLKALGDPIQRRFYEFEHREAAVQQLKSSIHQAVNWAQNNKEEKYVHIPDEDRQKVINEANQTDQWLVNSLIQQDRQPKTANPVITVQQIQQKKDALEKLTNQIMSKPKPAPPKVEPKPAEATQQQQQQQQSSGDQKPSSSSSSGGSEAKPETSEPTMDTSA